MNYLDDLYDMYETLIHELGEANEKVKNAGGKLSGSDLDYVDKLTHALKSLKTTIAMAEAEHGDRGYGKGSRGMGNPWVERYSPRYGAEYR